MAERNIDVRVRLKGADTFKQGMKGVEQSMSWLDVTKGILGSQVIQKAFQELTQLITSSVDASIKFESAMAGLQKTASLSDTALAEMGLRIMELSERVPMSSTEIAKLADTVAHLGLQRDQILPFTEVMIALGEATDMTAEQASTALAQLANVMGTTSAEYERLGSTIFELGRSSATTESAIVEMASAMAGSASLVGMSEADVLAFSAALSSIGVEAASGATSVQKLATQFELMTASGSEDLEKFASVAGMTAEQFTEAWSADPASVMASFITGLGQLDETGGSAIATLNDLGIKEVRLTRNIAGMAAAGDLLNRSLETSRQAWQDNTALAEATSIAYNTTASRLQIAQNAVENMKIAAGDFFKETKVEFAEVSAETAKSLRNSITDSSLQRQIDRINSKYDATGKALATARDQAMNLVQTLADMGSPEGLDSQGLETYEATMGALIKMVPEAAALFDNSTHAINGDADALREVVQQQYEVANSANDLQRSSESVEAYSQKVKTLGQLREQQALALAELNAAEAEYTKYLETHTANEALNSEELARLDKAHEAYNSISKDVSEAEDHLSRFVYLEDDAIAAADNMSAAISSVGSTADAQGDGITRLEGKLKTASAEAAQIIADFDAALEEAKKNVDKVFKEPFGGMGKVEARGTNSVVEALEKQQEYAENYVKWLEKAKELGASDDLLSQLSDGSEGSASVLKGIVEDNGATIDELNEKYASVQAAKDTMAAAMADAASQASARMAEVESAVQGMVDAADQSSTASANASSTIQGLIDGIDSNIGKLRAKVSEVNSLMAQLASGGGADGSHAAGLSYVPFDGYLAQLHRGEMVLTALEAKAYRAEQFANYGMVPRLQQMSNINNNQKTVTSQVTNNFNFGGVTTHRESDVDHLARELNSLIKRDQKLVGA